MGPELLFDAVLAIFLLGMAWGALHAPRQSTAIALFVALGMMVALAWARLGAPDLALAEAAIGAGLTGVLLLRTLASSPAPGNPPIDRARLPIRSLSFIGIGMTLLALPVLRASIGETGQQPILPGLVAANLDRSGVSHPVTAVLLNFRAWDTLLELLVLLIALIGFRELYPDREPIANRPGAAHQAPAPWPLLLAWSRSITPLLLITAGYVLWRGTSAPGGAFQAGAILASVAVLLRLNHLLPPLRWSNLLVRGTILAGPILFLTVACLSSALGAGWLDYPREWASALIIGIELCATVSIATTLALLVIGEREDVSA